MSSVDGKRDGERTGNGSTSLPREIWVLVLGSFIIAVGMGIVSPALPTFAASFGVGVTAASFVISAFALMRLAFAPVSGRLTTRFGELPIYVLGIGLVGVSTVACAFAASYWQLLVFRALGGIGSTMFTVATLALLVRLAPPHLRGRASGLWATGFLLGNISGPLVGGLLIGFSFRLPFLAYGVTLFVAAFAGWLMLRRSELAAREPDGGAPGITVREALGSRTYRAALLSNFSKGWAVNGVRISLVPLFVVQALDSTREMAGVALSVFAAGNAAVLLVSGRLSDRWGRRPMALLGLAVSAGGTGWLGLSGSVPWFLVASLVAGVGAGMLNPAQSAAVADLVGSRSGRGGSGGGSVLAVFQMAADAGTIAGPLITGALADTTSFPSAFLATAAISALALLLWVRATETREPAA